MGGAEKMYVRGTHGMACMRSQVMEGCVHHPADAGDGAVVQRLPVQTFTQCPNPFLTVELMVASVAFDADFGSVWLEDPQPIDSANLC